MAIVLGEKAQVPGADLLIVENGVRALLTGYLDADGNVAFDDADNEYTTTGNDDLGNGLIRYVASRPLDTGDDQDYVVVRDSAWDLGWAMCTTSTDLNEPADQSGCLKFSASGTLSVVDCNADDGATSLAGLTLASVAALALLIS